MKGRVSEWTNSFLYGSGVFTTLRVVNGEPFLWEKHWRRLFDHAEKIGLSTEGVDEAAVRESIDSLGVQTAKVRITIADETPAGLWSEGGTPISQVSTITAPLRDAPRELRLGISGRAISSTSPLAGLKTCNYLEPLLAYREAHGAGFKEALRLNERGHVVSACMANVFWLSKGKLFTPGLSTGCLAGTIRELIFENLDCEETDAEIEDVMQAESIFLTSSGLGVIEISEFEGRRLAPSGHPILRIVPGSS